MKGYKNRPRCSAAVSFMRLHEEYTCYTVILMLKDFPISDGTWEYQDYNVLPRTFRGYTQALRETEKNDIPCSLKSDAFPISRSNQKFLETLIKRYSIT